MKRIWILFSQAVTVLLAVWFVIVTLQPQWLPHVWPSTSSSTGAAAAGAALIQDSRPAVQPVAGSLSAAVKVALPSVVSISVQTGSQDSVRRFRGPEAWRRFFEEAQPEVEDDESQGMGSGVIVSADGLILTNNHVVEEARNIEVQLADGRKAKAEVVGADPETDLALLRVSIGSLPAIALGDLNQVQVGDVVLAIGNPFGVGQTVTSGIVSALGRNDLGITTFENFIQTDAAINPGNSGGALVDVQGRLLGINSAIYSRSGGNMGIGFAIPVSIAQQTMDSLLKNGRVLRGWLGVEPLPINADVINALKLKPAEGQSSISGVAINGVMRNGPAEKAGVQPGDVITQVSEQKISTVPQLLETVAALKPGASVKVQVLRQGRMQQLQIQIGERPSSKRENKRR